MDNYQNFDIGELQRNFELDRTLELIKRPVERYSYALMRAALNVFVQHYFANYLNSLVFDRVSFGSEVRNYVPQVWPHYLEDAQKTLTSAKISQLGALEFKDWGPEGANQFGAWHLLVFPEFKCNILLQISNSKSRLGAFEGLCFLENDQNALCELPTDRENTCHNLGPLHLQLIIDEMLEALGISPGSAMSAIKWQMS
jgi:hypothetical protein